ncbi:MAG: hypothetical protein ACN6O3_05860 [Comamonas sp.]
MNSSTLLSLAAMTALLAGCGSTTPHYDARFGEAVRTAKARMTINPEAGKAPGSGVDAATGMDGRVTRETMVRYERSFRTPPPAANVINIGTTLGSGGGGGTGAGSGDSGGSAPY